MRKRFVIYGSLLFVALALPVIYKTMETNIQKQEALIQKQKKDWFFTMVDVECKLAGQATTSKIFWYHYRKACDYFISALEIVQQEIKDLEN